MTVLDRRRFLLGAVGTASAVAGVAWWARLPAIASSPALVSAPTLAAQRAATFRALADSLQDAPGGRFGVIGADVAEQRFADWYATQDPTVQAHADAVLDAVGERPVPAYERLAEGASACHRAVAAPRSAAVAAAVDLVAVVSEPPPAEDERPAVPALELPA